jgi:hypothetical protein
MKQIDSSSFVTLISQTLKFIKFNRYDTVIIKLKSNQDSNDYIKIELLHFFISWKNSYASNSTRYFKQWMQIKLISLFSLEVFILNINLLSLNALSYSNMLNHQVLQLNEPDGGQVVARVRYFLAR